MKGRWKKAEPSGAWACVLLEKPREGILVRDSPGSSALAGAYVGPSEREAQAPSKPNVITEQGNSRTASRALLPGLNLCQREQKAEEDVPTPETLCFPVSTGALLFKPTSRSGSERKGRLQDRSITVRF